MKIYSFIIIISLLKINFCFAQEKKSDTLFILTDYAKEKELYFNKISPLKIEVREEKEIPRVSPSGLISYKEKIPAIKIIPKNKILYDLMSKKQLNTFPIGIQKNICFADKVFQKKSCDGVRSLKFIHRDIDFEFLDDYNTYLDVKDTIEERRKIILLPHKTPRNTYGKIIMNLDIIKNKYNYTDLSEFTKRTFFFDYNGLTELAKKYNAIYIESERIDPNTIIFEKVEYEYYIDDM
ncbi:hypothetical protein [Chryseobacterium gambrini]|uniref:hypothetical protein n=1 Tax=Chryseobacterium gambrini TaxID=373672 RepID=UPI0022F38C60|nr:hypothetical protein [Chryseobacterium gambrini]WBX96186.1 hypothetical protein PE065_15205 [Chryseobacterium gambrini]